MKVTIEKSNLKGYVQAPPSKSMAHRLLICGGLSEGKSVIHGVAPSFDVLATLDCLKALGAEYTYENNTVEICGTGKPGYTSEILRCRESGSTLRFFIPLCMNGNGAVKLKGSETLLNRPLGVYEDICRNQNIEFRNDGEYITVSGKLSPGEYNIPGNISSQFITGLMFALPLLEEDSKINIIPPVESRPYIDMTMYALNEFGVMAEWIDDNTIYIKGSQSYCSREVQVEGDYSNAAFFDALNYLGGEVTVGGLSEESLQGDKIYKELFEKLKNEKTVIDISDCPDLGPVLFAVAAAGKGGLFTGTRRLKIKESNRAAVMAEELSKFGVRVIEKEDSAEIIPTEFYKPTEILNGHNDHRIVMSLSLLLTLFGGSIDGAEAVNKSFPDFFEKMEQIGLIAKYEI